MWSLLVLAALVLLGAPIVLLFLVLGARSRVETLETRVDELQDELHRLHTQVAARPFSGAPAAAMTPATQEAVQEAAPQAPPEPESPRAEALASVLADQRAELAAVEEADAAAPDWDGPATVPSPDSLYESTEDEAHEPLPEITPYEPAPPPAWMLKAKEWLFGGNLVAKAGLLILFFGVSFLLKYAAARVSVPIELRLAGITLADIGLLLWGWRIRLTRPAISLPVQGAALAILMLVTFGAFRIYHLIPGGLAFTLLFVLTFFTCLLAVLQNAPWLAVFGIAGGFAAPILTSTGQGSHIALFSYYALLNAGILAIALKRSWRLLNLLGFAFTFVISTAWGVLRYQPENYASVQGFLILFVLFYVAIAVIYALRQAPRLGHYVDGTLVFGTPLLAFGLQYGIIHDRPFGLAFSALALGLFYTVLTLALWRKRGSSLQLLIESFLALGIIFGTLTIPFALDGRWTSAAWALEGAGIVWIGLRQKQTLAWVFGVLVQVGAWISFVGSVSGLNAQVAAESNLWLGFLLLAGTGLAMAMNFRKRTLDEPAPTSPWMTVLATLFLGFASLWLLAGAWTEIFLHAHGGGEGTLLALSGVMVAGILGIIASRLNWGIARYFALVPQIAAGLLLILLFWGLVDGHSLNPSSTDLFAGPFLGALLIALSAGFSARVFARQPEGERRGLSRILLGWSALWWFVLVLPSFADWCEVMLAAYTTFAASRHDLFFALYNLVVAMGALGFARLATRLDWDDLRWPAAAVWPALLVATLSILETLTHNNHSLPSGMAWAGWVALWLGSEYLLADSQRKDWLAADQRPLLLRTLHALRTVGPWLILWPLGHHLITLALQAGPDEQAILLAEAGWFTAGSWAHTLPAWAMMAFVALLMPRVRSNGWPVPPLAEWYRRVLIPLGALWSLGLVVVWNFTQNGRMDPLPYLPVLNPLDLSTGFAALLAIAAWRLRNEDTISPSETPALPIFTVGLVRFAALFAFVWFNLMVLRTAAHALDIPYQWAELYASQFIQTLLSLVWCATALVTMRFAAQRRYRAPWMAGAGLLALVVAKLFFIDLSNVGGIERIVSFLGVGVLMLAIGYLAPFPTEKAETQEPAQ